MNKFNRRVRESVERELSCDAVRRRTCPRRESTKADAAEDFGDAIQVMFESRRAGLVLLNLVKAERKQHAKRGDDREGQ